MTSDDLPEGPVGSQAHLFEFTMGVQLLVAVLVFDKKMHCIMFGEFEENFYFIFFFGTAEINDFKLYVCCIVEVLALPLANTQMPVKLQPFLVTYRNWQPNLLENKKNQWVLQCHVCIHLRFWIFLTFFSCPQTHAFQTPLPVFHFEPHICQGGPLFLITWRPWFKNPRENCLELNNIPYLWHCWVSHTSSCWSFNENNIFLSVSCSFF